MPNQQLLKDNYYLVGVQCPLAQVQDYSSYSITRTLKKYKKTLKTNKKIPYTQNMISP